MIEEVTEDPLKPIKGNDMDTYAADVAELVEFPDLKGCYPCRAFNRWWQRRSGMPPKTEKRPGIQSGFDQRNYTLYDC